MQGPRGGNTSSIFCQAAELHWHKVREGADTAVEACRRSQENKAGGTQEPWKYTKLKKKENSYIKNNQKMLDGCWSPNKRTEPVLLKSGSRRDSGTCTQQRFSPVKPWLGVKDHRSQNQCCWFNCECSAETSWREPDKGRGRQQLVIQSYTVRGGSSCAGHPPNSIRCPLKYPVEPGGETAWRYQRWGDLTGKSRRTERCLKVLLHDVLKVRPCREWLSDLSSLEHLFCLQGFRWVESILAALWWGTDNTSERLSFTPMECRVAIQS